MQLLPENQELKSIFGAAVRATRMRQNMKQEDLAEKASIDRATIQRIEGGGGTSLENAWNIAEALDVPISDLLPRGRRDEEVLYHASRVSFFRTYIALLGVHESSAQRGKILATIARHPRVREAIERVFKMIEEGATTSEAFEAEEELCGGLQDIMTVAARTGLGEIIWEIVRDAENSLELARSRKD